MYIKSAKIKNFRLFKNEFLLTEDRINVPDGRTLGSGLTILVGENGTGKSAVLEALAIPVLSYRAENVCLNDFYNINTDIEITLNADTQFDVKKTVPRGSFNAVGFNFKAHLRQQQQRRFLSASIVSDSYYLPAIGESIPDNSPDLRTAVNNPFSGPRFNKNDYLYIDKNRIKQLESGMFSPTRFDRLLNDFNFQYLKTNSTSLLNPNAAVINELSPSNINNDYLNEAFDKFKELTGYEVNLSFINNQEPYTKAYLTYSDGNSQQLPVEKLGSGYQMFLAIICQYFLSLQSEKDLIIFIDEVELHLHYKLQLSLANLLLAISAKTQIIVSTHSAQLLKDLRENEKHIINVMKKVDHSISINPIEEYVLPSPSVNEASYVAFQLPGIEYYNELYGYLQDLTGITSISAFDAEISAGETMYSWERDDRPPESLSIHTCLRHKIHHPDNTLNDNKFDFNTELPKSIEYFRQKIRSFNLE